MKFFEGRQVFLFIGIFCILLTLNAITDKKKLECSRTVIHGILLSGIEKKITGCEELNEVKKDKHEDT